MSDEKQPAPGTEPAPEKPLTAEEQIQAQADEQQQIEGQFATADMMERLPDIFAGWLGFGSSGGSVFGSTAFDGHRLNTMLDFLESANPEQLESAGTALNKANTDINRAAEDLAKFVADVDWQGEGAEEFRRYGSEVVSYAWSIARMANAAGAQMKVASEGLASVRNSRPPRDNRLVQKDAKDFEIPERTADNEDYQKALQVEKNRQEAINQMNRLASFYAVSESTLARQELPKPPEAYRAAVPQPSGKRDTEGGNGPTFTGSTQPSAAFASSTRGGDGESVQRPGPLGKADPVTDTAMKIDSVTTAPPPTTTGPGQQQPVVTTTNPTTGPVGGPPVSPFAPPGRTTGPTTANGRTFKPGGREGVPGPAQQTGRSAQGYGRPMTPTTTGPSNTTGRGQSPMVGRPGGPGMPAGGTQNRQTPAAGRGQSPMVGRPGGPGMPAGGQNRQTPAAGRGQSPMAGRPGGPGAPAGRQTPATGRGQSPIVGRPVGGPGQSANGRTGPASPAAGRPSGIVGGTPQRTTGRSAGSQLPRGTVIGAESRNSGSQPAGRPGQAGVVGANTQNRPARPAGRGTPSANGVVGTPRAAGARPADARSDQQRSDHPSDDEQTRTNHRRGPVPPVIG